MIGIIIVFLCENFISNVYKYCVLLITDKKRKNIVIAQQQRKSAVLAARHSFCLNSSVIRDLFVVLYGRRCVHITYFDSCCVAFFR